MPSNTYTVGDQAVLTATFASNGVLVDPTTVSVSVKKPNGTILNPSPTHVSTGIFQIIQFFDVPGDWHWKTVATGAAVAASSPDQGILHVRAQPF